MPVMALPKYSLRLLFVVTTLAACLVAIASRLQREFVVADHTLSSDDVQLPTYADLDKARFRRDVLDYLDQEWPQHGLAEDDLHFLESTTLLGRVTRAMYYPRFGVCRFRFSDGWYYDFPADDPRVQEANRAVRAAIDYASQEAARTCRVPAKEPTRAELLMLLGTDSSFSEDDFSRAIDCESADRYEAVFRIGVFLHGTADARASALLAKITCDPTAPGDLRWLAYVGLLDVQGRFVVEEVKSPIQGFEVPADFDMDFVHRFTGDGDRSTAEAEVGAGNGHP